LQTLSITACDSADKNVSRATRIYRLPDATGSSTSYSHRATRAARRKESRGVYPLANTLACQLAETSLSHESSTSASQGALRTPSVRFQGGRRGLARKHHFWCAAATDAVVTTVFPTSLPNVSISEKYVHLPRPAGALCGVSQVKPLHLSVICNQQRLAQSLHIESQASVRMLVPCSLKFFTETRARSPCQRLSAPQGSGSTDMAAVVVAGGVGAALVVVVVVTRLASPSEQPPHSSGNSCATRDRACESFREPPAEDISQVIRAPQV